MTLRQNVKEMPDLNDYMTTEEAARVLGFNVGSIRNMARRGVFETIKVGRTYLVSKRSIEDYKRRTYDMSPNDPRRGRLKD